MKVLVIATLRIQVTRRRSGADEYPVLDPPIARLRRMRLPAVKILAVEESDETVSKWLSSRSGIPLAHVSRLPVVSPSPVPKIPPEAVVPDDQVMLRIAIAAVVRLTCTHVPGGIPHLLAVDPNPPPLDHLVGRASQAFFKPPSRTRDVTKRLASSFSTMARCPPISWHLRRTDTNLTVR